MGAARNQPENKSQAIAAPPAPEPPPSLYRRVDWIAFGVTTLAVLAGYLLTLAPDLTLGDSGELAVGSYYAGVPHPPGYPVWTLYTWLFTVLLPVSNIAFRVSVASAVSAASACGLLALMVSRGGGLIIEGIADLRELDKRIEGAICLISGFVAGCLLAFNGFFWSQAIIVEVYCFGVLSLMGVLCCLLRWMYAPERFRFLYLAAFLFGICFTNHQTLLVAAMGVEVAVLAADRKLGRDLFLLNSVIYLAVLFARHQGMVAAFDGNLPLFMVFNAIGIASIYTAFWFLLDVKAMTRLKCLGAHLAGNVVLVGLLTQKQNPGGDLAQTLQLARDHTLLLALYNLIGIGLLHAYFAIAHRAAIPFRSWKNEVKPFLLLALLWAVGVGFNLYMPVTSMTNPPMNWGYPRTIEGFIHVLSRGQYEPAHPTTDLWSFANQSRMYIEGAVEEFNGVYLLVALVPLFFLAKMRQRERAWMAGLIAIFLCLGPLLLIIMNPHTDRASRDLIKVFFTASYSILALLIGYGLTMIAAHAAAVYQKCRSTLVLAASFAAAIFLVFLVMELTAPSYPLKFYAALFGLGLGTAFSLFLIASKTKAPMPGLLAIMALMPVHPILSHWADNEQSGHLFGYWFGHDMFTPPDFGKTGQLYPEMSRDAILFGGTDPGRFCPTYMIFCESFIPPEKRRDPKFDRRDVYIITQNALVDKTYPNYIRAHYNRSTQKDPPFFQNLFRSEAEIQTNVYTNGLAGLAAPLDTLFTNYGNKVEARRRQQGVYPSREIYIPTSEETQECINEYVTAVRRSMASGPPGENESLHTGDSRMTLNSQASIMHINGMVAKIIFDKNPGHEFYVEESLALDWMFPHLTPFGIIMKVNRQPVAEFTEEIVNKDHLFWSLYSERLCGNWIDYDTPVAKICDFVERVYRHHDYSGFRGDPRFVRDNDAQKAFSKLRTALSGLYLWRASASKPGSAEQRRVSREAEFAMKQAFAFCPYNMEIVIRYINLLLSSGRFDDAIRVAATCQQLDPENEVIRGCASQIQGMKEKSKVQKTN
jgi:hypothetical protein